MKKFLKLTLASILGFVFGSIILFLLFIVGISAIASKTNSEPTISPNSVYKISLKGELLERSETSQLSDILNEAVGNTSNKSIGLDDLLKNISKAKTDKNILGIYLEGGSMSCGIASAREIRNALIDFKKTGKFIVAYADNYSQKMYYIASVADKLLINPEGMIELKGLSTEIMFFKNTLDKLGIDMQIVKVGTYKSAVEPFSSTQMSEANKQQVEVYLQSIWGTMAQEIAESRKLTKEKIDSYANEMMAFQASSKYLQYGLVDSIAYVDEAIKTLKTYTKEDDINFVSHNSYTKIASTPKTETKNIAVLYAVGDITDEEGDGIVGSSMIKEIENIAADSSINAVVIRVNSPGGSAFASEQIWHALKVLKHQKPIYVSMGDYAASGGYYISCIAQKIIAQPNTITGSIGIFGVIPNLEKLNEKLGISYDGVKTHKMSDAISFNRKFSIEEKDLMQNYVNRGYDLFVSRCAEGRKMSKEQIMHIAEGRVWTGIDAQKIGLVDKIGGLEDAIKIAAKETKLTKYGIVEFPRKESLDEKIFKNLGEDVQESVMKTQLGEQYTIYKKLHKLSQLNGIQATLPIEINIR